MSGERLTDGVDDRSKKSKERMNVTVFDSTGPVEICFSAPAIITPIAAQRSPVDDVATSSYTFSSSPEDALRLGLEQARSDAEQCAQALERLTSGIRAVKRVLEAGSSGEDASRQNCINEDLRQIHQLSESLQGVLGSDFLALVNTADMIREHARLAFQETSDVVADLRKAKQEAHSAAVEAKRAVKVARALFKTNTALKSQVDKLLQEKRVLVKEVKTLREQRVLNSLTVHELVLKTPSSTFSKKKHFQVDAAEDDAFEGAIEEGSRLRKGSGFKRGFRIFRRTTKAANEDTSCPEPPGDAMDSKNNDDGLLRGFGTPTRHFPKSPVPGLDEISLSTGDSSSVRIIDKTTGKDEMVSPSLEDGPPFILKNSNTASQPSPVVTPDGAPVHKYKYICDPHILRTLEIPSSRDDVQEFEELLSSPRQKVTESLCVY